MANTEILTGTVTAAEWREGPRLDYYGIDLATDDGRTIEVKGTDRLNIFPTAGQRIRVAAAPTPKGRYQVRRLRNEVDPASQQMIQIEVL